MAGSMKLTFEEMKANCGKLNEYANDYDTTEEQVISLVGSFTGVWEGEAEAKFEEDYNVLAQSMKTTIETMREITALVTKYVSAHQEIDESYGKNHVSFR